MWWCLPPFCIWTLPSVWYLSSWYVPDNVLIRHPLGPVFLLLHALPLSRSLGMCARAIVVPLICPGNYWSEVQSHKGTEQPEAGAVFWTQTHKPHVGKISSWWVIKESLGLGVWFSGRELAWHARGLGFHSQVCRGKRNALKGYLGWSLVPLWSISMKQHLVWKGKQGGVMSTLEWNFSGSVVMSDASGRRSEIWVVPLLPPCRAANLWPLVFLSSHRYQCHMPSVVTWGGSTKQFCLKGWCTAYLAFVCTYSSEFERIHSSM